MSAPAHSESFLERFWPFLVIFFGLLFVTLIITYQPSL